MTERSAPWSGRVLGEDGWPDKALGLRNSRLHLGCLERVGPPDAEKNRRSRVASLKLRTGSAASLASLGDGLTVAIRRRAATRSLF